MLNPSTLDKSAVILTAQSIDDLVKRKDWANLSTYIFNVGYDWREWMPWKTEHSPFKTAFEERNLTAINLLFMPYVTFNTYRTLSSEDRLKLAPYFVDENDPQFAHRGPMFAAAVTDVSLPEIKYWHEERNEFYRLLRCCVCKFEDPLRQAINKQNIELVDYLIKTVKHSIPEMDSYDSMVVLLRNKLWARDFNIAEYLLPLVLDLYESRGPNSRASIVQLVIIDNRPHERIQTRTEIIQWLLNKGVTKFDENLPILAEYSNKNQLPAFVLACFYGYYQIAKLLYEFDTEKWKNNAGPIIELLASRPIPRQDKDFYNTAENQEISSILELLVSLLHPETKERDLANGLAAAIVHGHLFLEQKLREHGADLNLVTEKEKYHYRTGCTFGARVKLLGPRDELLTELDEDKYYIVDRISIKTKTGNMTKVKSMKNIQPGSDIYFEASAYFTDPKVNSWWMQFKNVIRSAPGITPIRVLDKVTGKIYKDTQHVRDLFVGPTSTIEFGPLFKDKLPEQYALFILMTTESWPNNYRIMYKPIEVPHEKVIEPMYEEPQVEEKKEADDELDGPRRSRRGAAKRKANVMEAGASDEEEPIRKRRKVKKT